MLQVSQIPFRPSASRLHSDADLFTGFYHVQCFEELLDLDSPHYVVRFEPDMNGFRPDLGARKVFQEYISRWEARIKQVDTKPTASEKTSDIFSDIHTAAGDGEAPPVSEEAVEVDVWKIADSIYKQARQAKTGTGASQQQTPTNGNGQQAGWHITQYLLRETDPGYVKRHSLSMALESWKDVLASKPWEK